MSMTTGDELGKSDVFLKLAVKLSPLVEEAVRQVINQFLIAQRDGDPGETTAQPADSNNDHLWTSG